MADEEKKQQSNSELPPQTGSWTLSVAGIAKSTGFMVQVSHTVEGGLAQALKGFEDMTEFFKKHEVSSIAPALAGAFENVLNPAVEKIVESIPKPPPPPDVIKSVKVSEMKLMYTNNSNPHLMVKASPGLMAHGLPAWPETWEKFLGDEKAVVSKYGVAKVIPIPPEMQWAQAEYKGTVAHKIIGFSSDAG